MAKLIERRYELKPNKLDLLLGMHDELIKNLKSDPHIKGAVIITPEGEEDVVIYRYALHEDADWKKRMEQEYVKAFLKEVAEKDLVKEIKEKTFNLHHRH